MPINEGVDGSTPHPMKVDANGNQHVLIENNFIVKARIFNTVLPAANNDLIGTDIVPTTSPSYIRIYTVMSVSGVLNVMRTVGGNTITEQLNNGIALTADAAYMFAIPWRTGDSINVQYTVTAGNTLILDIVEAQGVE